MSIELNNIYFTYNKTPLLDGLSLKIESGEIATLIGASGSGKTTILQLLCGLLKPDSGSVAINSPGSIAHSVQYMMQNPMLLPWRTVLDNLTLIHELGSKQPVQKERALSLLEELGLKGWEDCYPDELSGGMQQRVALGRALMQNSPALVLDEPFSSLDVALREQLYGLLRSIRDKYGTTILLVTHDFYDALALSDRILLLKKGTIANEWQRQDVNETLLRREMRYSHSIVPGGLAVTS